MRVQYHTFGARGGGGQSQPKWVQSHDLVNGSKTGRSQTQT
jgi:hypothetical protein